MSPGDVVEYHDKFYLVCGAGWKELSQSQFNDYKKKSHREKINFAYSFEN